MGLKILARNPYPNGGCLGGVHVADKLSDLLKLMRPDIAWD